MAREKIHGRHCRRTGCNCDEGKADHARYMRERRAIKRAEAEKLAAENSEPGTIQQVNSRQLRLVNSPVVERIHNEAPASPARTITVESDRPLGRTGLAVLRQISHMLDEAQQDERAAEVALALSLASTVDRATEPKDTTAAARELRAVLNGLKPAPGAQRQESAQELLLRKLAEPL